MNRVLDSLNLCYRSHGLVFWYDPSGEWKKVFESSQTTSARLRDVGYVVKTTPLQFEGVAAPIPGLAQKED